jgi:broad specificity phosphatase PhoE
MTRFYLIRHGENDFVSRGAIAGRQPNVHLNDRGRAQAGRIAGGLANEPIEQIFSSPLERCRETAQPLASRLNLEIQLADELLEVDYGQWTSRTFAELDNSELWRQYNAFRSGTRIPGGEMMIEIQARIVGFLEKQSQLSPSRKIAVITHGDVIRAALLNYLGMPLDFVHRLKIDMGSVSTVAIYSDRGVEVERINGRC